MNFKKPSDAVGKEKSLIDSLVDFGPDEVTLSPSAPATQQKISDLSKKIKDLNERLEKLAEKL